MAIISNHPFVGIREVNKNIKITFVNGILNTGNSCEVTSNEISAYHGFNRVYFVNDQSKGVIRDLWEAQRLIWGNSTDGVMKLVMLWKSLLAEIDMNDPKSKIIHYAHSRGGLVTEVAMRYLTEGERGKLCIYILGSPTTIKEGQCKDCKNIYNSRDWVPVTNPSKIQYMVAPLANDKIVPSSAWFFEHGILDNAYLNQIKMLGDQFLIEAKG